MNHPDIGLVPGPLEKKMKARNLKFISLGNCVSYAPKRMCNIVMARSWGIF